MDKLLGTNRIFEETNATAKVRGFGPSTLAFFIIFLAGNIIGGVITFIPTLVYSIQSTFALDNASTLLDYMSLLALPDWMIAFNLLGTLGTIIAAFIYCKYYERRSLFTFGFTKKNWLKEYLIGLAIGLLMFALSFFIIIISGQGEFDGFSSFNFGIIFIFIGFLIQGMSEEVLLRSFYFTTLGATKNMTFGVIISSVIFAALHLFNPGITLLSIVNLTLFGIFAAIYYLRRGNIWGIGAIHSMWNFAQGNLFGFRVSGTNAGSSIFFTSIDYENTLINGGNFGPEGGLGVTIVLTLSIVVVLFFMKNKEVEE